jgi:hypothetical protein
MNDAPENESFEAKLKATLPLVAKDETGRWFCALPNRGSIAFRFFPNEQRANQCMSDYLVSSRNSN